MTIYIGTAGWGIPKEHSERFGPVDAPPDGGARPTHLERYSRHLSAAEINSSFYRSHRPQTYARWAASVPESFSFSVKMPRQITHVQKLRDSKELLAQFLSEVEALGDRLGPLLVQLPPSLAFEETVTGTFFAAVRELHPAPAPVVCEPRHATWFSEDAGRILRQFEIGRVAADPPVPVPEAARPGAGGRTTYYRLHGSPRIYYSAYSDEFLRTLAQTIAETLDASPEPGDTWCIFDNTAAGEAAANALYLTERLSPHGTSAG